jgi:uncharacterized protein (DUF58 family)
MSKHFSPPTVQQFSSITLVLNHRTRAEVLKAPDLLDPVAISQAEALGLAARSIVEGFMAGEHKSPFHGFAVEFTQHREYAPGDDLRHLDWKVLGRTDKYMLKQYEQETNYVAHILVDGSESMAYGSGGAGKITKLQYAKQLAACLSYMILLQRDAISLSVFDTSVSAHLPRTGNLGSIHSVMELLSRFEATATTNIAAVLHRLSGEIKRRGIVILISDLFDDEDSVLRGIQHLRFGGSEVILFHVMDSFELNFPFQGTVEFVGLEQIPNITTRPAEIRKSYLKRMNEFRDRVRLGCERNNVHYQMVDTSKTLHETLTGYLAFRRRAGK